MTHHTTPLMVQSLVWIIMNISTKENQIINTKLLYIVIHTFIPWFGIYKYLDFLEFYGNFMKEFDILDMGFSTHLFSLADFGGFDKTKISISPPVIHHLKITQPMKTGFFFFFFFLKYHPYLWTCSDPFTYPIKKIWGCLFFIFCSFMKSEILCMAEEILCSLIIHLGTSEH